MLRRVGQELNTEDVKIHIKDMSFPAPFKEGLEYSSPARGTWNIVHTGMLIPDSHQIFVCAQGCLRGVVLTAAEMNALNRYSSILIKEDNVLDGTMEELMIGGVTDIIEKLDYRPKAILLFISCQHFFLAYDQQLVFEELRSRFPDIKFADCYMIPTLRKSGITPDQKMRIQMYSMLDDVPKNPKKINLIGSNHAIEPTCEMLSMIKNAGYEIQALNWCETFDDYLAMGESILNIYYEPLAEMSAKELRTRIGQDYIYMPFSFNKDTLLKSYQTLADKLGFAMPDLTNQINQSEEALKKAKAVIGEHEIAIDATFTFKILSLTRLLIEHGFRVTQIFADAFSMEEQADYQWLLEHAPDLLVSSISRPKMRFLANENDESILALGQKAAYFTGTNHFVNVVESGGYYGFDGITKIAEMMIEAFEEEKDRKDIIQRKGYRCESLV